MAEHYRDDWLTVHLGDCREVMAAMEPESVHCVVTSPPYWGLRDYGTATWTGGDAECDHLVGPLASAKSGSNGMPFKGHCGKCGAIRQDGQLGLEPTPELYVQSMVDVFRAVHRVLRKDGTVWLNLGDSYAGGGGFAPNAPSNQARAEGGAGVYDGLNWSPRIAEAQPTGKPKGIATPGLKPKDLVGIPWRVAFALQADGWYLRSDIIWAKPNPMPESVTDRPTKAHEYVFLLSKSPRYYYDADAVRRPISPYNEGRISVAPHGAHVMGEGYRKNEMRTYDEIEGANMRTVWEIATQPYPGAHFATFPRALVEPCIKAGCPMLGTVLDPFAGSGTTGLVAQSLSRRAVLIDLSAEYLEQLMDRNAQKPLGLGA